jgi:hypothetical protein
MRQIVLRGFRLFGAIKKQRTLLPYFLVMKLKRLKLSDSSDKSLKDKEMNALKGGNCCNCSCYWEDKGGSSVEDNTSANYSFNGTSEHGCNEYTECDGYDNTWWPEQEHA